MIRCLISAKLSAPKLVSDPRACSRTATSKPRSRRPCSPRFAPHAPGARLNPVMTTISKICELSPEARQAIRNRIADDCAAQAETAEAPEEHCRAQGYSRDGRALWASQLWPRGTTFL